MPNGNSYGNQSGISVYNVGTILVKATESDTTTTIPTMGRSMPCFGGKEDFFDHGGYLQHWLAAIFSSDDLFEAPKCSCTFVL